jgi:hypothetical protein
MPVVIIILIIITRMLLMLLLLRRRGRVRLIRSLLVRHHLLLNTTSTSRCAIGVVLLRRVSLPLTSCRRRRWRVKLLVVRIERVFFLLLLLRAVLVFHF